MEEFNKEKEAAKKEQERQKAYEQQKKANQQALEKKKQELQKKQEQLMRLVILMELWKTCLIIVLPLELMRFHMQGRFVWDVSETGTGQ